MTKNKPIKYSFLIILSALLIIIISIIIYKMSTVKHYLNYNSTSSNEFNYSDLLYPENEFDRMRIEELKAKVLNIVNAPVGSKCIINSGATESIASCIKWSNDYINKGIIVGSKYDHIAVESNAKNMNMKYKKIDITKDELPDNTAAIFITQVDSSTGEYQDMNSIISNLEKEKYIIDGGDINDNDRVLQYHPLIFLDATQSFMKLPIDMENDNINAVFFSVHKLGGEQGLGFLIINEANFPKYKPLIAGEQQLGLRGGTLPIQRLLEYPEIFEDIDDNLKRKTAWEHTYKKFKDANIKIYTPKTKHLYSTFLIDTKDKCSKEIISTLAKDGIYIGAKSACSLEPTNVSINDINESTDINKKDNSTNDSLKDNNEKDKLKGGSKNNKNIIRISFREPDELQDNIIQKIIDVLT